MNHLVSMNDLEREELLELVRLAGEIEEGRITPSTAGKVAAHGRKSV